jgi:hypothetical protein
VGEGNKGWGVKERKERSRGWRGFVIGVVYNDDAVAHSVVLLFVCLMSRKVWRRRLWVGVVV